MIRKFLDAQRMPQLAEYLEALHKQGLANSEHTTLLINCYTKLKEKEKLHDFIYSDQAGIHFDIEMAIEVLRRAQCFEEALHLSKKHHLFTTFLRIQIEDKQDLRAATDYIKYCFFFHFNAGPFPLSLLPQPCSYTADNFLPTSRFIRVLFPEFGAPHKPTLRMRVDAPFYIIIIMTIVYSMI